MEHLLQEHKIYIGCPIERRIKKWESFTEKLDRHNITISSVKELADLIGIRIILLFKRDINKFAKLIKKNFKVISIEDTSQRLAETQFGYASLHYTIEVPRHWLKIPKFSSFKDCKAEIQIRTLAQHIWASASHVLQYKQEVGVPPPLRRTIHRISAVLELVDLEFERILVEKQMYQKESIKTKTAEYLNTPEILKQLLKKHYKQVIEDDQKLVKEWREKSDVPSQIAMRIKRSVLLTHVGLTRQMIKCEKGDEIWGKYRKDVLSRKQQ